jgi:predicted phosphoadenosine phosphosulfate sulfurtransferase
MRNYLETNVLDAALSRFEYMYDNGEVVVSFSGGKDSQVCVELAVMVATYKNRLPVHVVYRDEEIVSPETFAFARRTAARPEINFIWLVANQPIINIFNRAMPYLWVYDPLLKPEEWMQLPPDIARFIPEKSIENMVNHRTIGVPEGRTIYSVMGLRSDESIRREWAIRYGYLTKPKNGKVNAKPIYD